MSKTASVKPKTKYEVYEVYEYEYVIETKTVSVCFTQQKHYQVKILTMYLLLNVACVLTDIYTLQIWGVITY